MPSPRTPAVPTPTSTPLTRPCDLHLSHYLLALPGPLQRNIQPVCAQSERAYIASNSPRVPAGVPGSPRKQLHRRPQISTGPPSHLHQLVRALLRSKRTRPPTALESIRTRLGVVNHQCDKYYPPPSRSRTRARDASKSLGMEHRRRPAQLRTELACSATIAVRSSCSDVLVPSRLLHGCCPWAIAGFCNPRSGLVSLKASFRQYRWGDPRPLLLPIMHA